VRDRALLAVAFSAALRRSEVVGIDVEHLSWNDRGVTLLIPKSKGDAGLQRSSLPLGFLEQRCSCECFDLEDGRGQQA
jgi:site-specific recombinase XerC